MPKFISIGTRLALGTVVLVFALTTAIYLGLTRFQWHTLVDGKSTSATAVSALFREVAGPAVIFDDTKGLDDAVHSLMSNPEVLFVRVSRTSATGPGETIVEQRRQGFTSPVDDLLRGDGPVTTSTEAVMVRDAVKDSDGAAIATASIAFSPEKEHASYDSLTRQILVVAFFAALAMIGLLMGMGRDLIVKPLNRLVTTAQRLQAGEHVSSGITSRDEVGQLASAFDAMAQAIWAREAEVQRRNRDLKLVLDNVSQGFLLVDAKGLMGPERSRVLDDWFGPPPPSNRFSEWIGARAPAFPQAFELSFEQLIEGFMPPDVSLDMLPRGFEAEGRHFAMHSHALHGPDGTSVQNLLIVLSDVTAEIEHQRSAKAQQETVEIFQWLLKDRAGFLAYLADGSEIVARLESGHQPPAVEMRDVHTLKGNSAVFGVQSVAALCHQIESRLMEERAALKLDERQAISMTWRVLNAAVERLGGKGRHAIEVPKPDYEDLLGALERGTAPEQISRLVRSWADDPAKARLTHLGDQARALASRLGKPLPTIEVEGDGVRLSPSRFGPFWSVMVHVVRNAVDHGLDDAEARERAGKSPTPTLRLTARKQGEAVVVEVSDDGRGIDWQRLAQKARAAGLPATTHEDLEAALFHDGISTRDAATDVSGRGVGMSAVLQTVTELDGKVGVVSRPGVGTTFRFEVPLYAEARLRKAS